MSRLSLLFYFLKIFVLFLKCLIRSTTKTVWTLNFIFGDIFIKNLISSLSTDLIRFGGGDCVNFDRLYFSRSMSIHLRCQIVGIKFFIVFAHNILISAAFSWYDLCSICDIYDFYSLFFLIRLYRDLFYILMFFNIFHFNQCWWIFGS